MSGNALATITGVILSAGAAAEPVFTAAGGGSLHQGDYVQLAIAVFTAIFGWFTKYKEKGE